MGRQGEVDLETLRTSTELFMDKKVEQQLEKMITGFCDYEIIFYPRSALDIQRSISVFHYEGITEQTQKQERLIIVRKGKAMEIDITKHSEMKYDYGDFRHEFEEGEPIRNRMQGDEEAILIVRSEFSTKPKGPHVSTKIIEVYES
jgi:hypothetical protein